MCFSMKFVQRVEGEGWWPQFIDGSGWWAYKQIRVSIVVSIPACHAGDPGSIPGRGAFFSKSRYFCFLINFKENLKILPGFIFN